MTCRERFLRLEVYRIWQANKYWHWLVRQLKREDEMPDLSEHGVGGCRHKYKDGRCWYCGEEEIDESDKALIKSLEENLEPKVVFMEELATKVEALRKKLDDVP